MNNNQEICKQYNFHKLSSIIETEETEESDSDNDITYNENIYNLIASQSLYHEDVSPKKISHEQIPENSNMNEVNNLLHDANKTDAIEDYATILSNQDNNNDSIIVDEEEEIQEEIQEEIETNDESEIGEIPDMNEIEQEYPKMQKVVQEESDYESEQEQQQQVYDIYDSRNSRNKQKKWDMKSWFDSLW